MVEKCRRWINSYNQGYRPKALATKKPAKSTIRKRLGVTSDMIKSLGEPENKKEQDFIDGVKHFRNTGLGFGRMMQMISCEWFKKDPVGAISLGPCYHFKKYKDGTYRP